MHSSHYSNQLLGYAREAYVRGQAHERRYGKGKANPGFARAYSILMDLCCENDVGIKPTDADAIEGLLTGDLRDVKDAFRILGTYAKSACDSARWFERH
jgi:hypothetical protein